MSLDEYGQPAGVIVVKNESDSGVKRFSVLGPADKVEVKKNEIQEKFPSMEYGMGGVRNAYVRST